MSGGGEEIKTSAAPHRTYINSGSRSNLAKIVSKKMLKYVKYGRWYWVKREIVVHTITKGIDQTQVIGMD